MKSTLLPCALLAALALAGCDRRETDGHSSTPPSEQGAATEAPAEAPADQSVQPAAPQPAEGTPAPSDTPLDPAAPPPATDTPPADDATATDNGTPAEPVDR